MQFDVYDDFYEIFSNIFQSKIVQILFGKNYQENLLKNYCQQMSPVIVETLSLSEENQEIVNIGDEKYRGLNKYLFHLELNFSTPECHLHLVGFRRGILGHPKNLYDTMLNLNDKLIRTMGWCESYDPHGLINRAFIKIHTSDDFVERFVSILNLT